jgi:large repetitive protein
MERACARRRLGRTAASVVFALVAVGAGFVPASAKALPTITSYSPASGLPGTAVTIDGSGFSATTSVTFNGVVAGFGVNPSGTQITTTVPGGATTGPLAVATPDGTASTSSDFTVLVEPSISGFQPTSGSVGTTVTITGANLLGSTEVKFKNTAAPGFAVNPGGTQITVVVPSGAATGKITVTTPVASAKSAGTFTIVVPGGPTIATFNPASGEVGDAVTITGAGFLGTTAVKFRSTQAVFAVTSDTQITTTVPQGAKTGPITVTTPVASAESSARFVVVTPTIPKVNKLEPRSGPVGTAVAVLGSGFLGASAVRFNGQAVAAFSVVSDSKITTAVPVGATSGPVSITSPLGTGTSAKAFTVTGPKIKEITPTSGYPGDAVTLKGDGFTGATAVMFAGVTAAFTIVDDDNATAVVPEGAASGKITLTTPAGTASSRSFKILAPHPRTISLSLTRRMVASGAVSASDDYAPCARYVPVTIVRFRDGTWRWVATTSTRADGTFRAVLLKRPGRYRARATRIELVNGEVCGKARSDVVKRSRSPRVVGFLRNVHHRSTSVPLPFVDAHTRRNRDSSRA